VSYNPTKPNRLKFNTKTFGFSIDHNAPFGSIVSNRDCQTPDPAMPERPAWYHPARWSHLSRWKLFFGLWAILLGLSVAVTAIGSLLAGGLQEWHALMTRLTPWWVVWRLGLYLVIGVLYWRRWRPRILVSVARDQDGGAAARYRLGRSERAVVIVIATLELFNVLSYAGGTQ